jgi:5-dehydro-2-deoxygluconokinase
LDDDAKTRAHHENLMLELDAACRATGHQWLLEIITARNGQGPDFNQVPNIMQRFYELGIKPDWWKLEPGPDKPYWDAVGAVIDKHDGYCQGIIVLGLDASIEQITEAFTSAAQQPWVKGFAIGRTLFAEAAQAWLKGNMDDAEAIALMRQQYRLTIDAWDQAISNNERR